MSNDPFDGPASTTGIDWKDLTGALLLITPHSAERVATAYGESDCVRADVAVLDGDHAGEEYKDTLIFPKVLAGSVRPNAGTGRMNSGRLGTGQAKPGQSAPWILSDPTDDDRAVARAHLANNKMPF